MKTWLFLLAAVVAGCEPVTQGICREVVQEEFKGGKVYMVPDHKWTFIVEDQNGDIWYVETLNSTISSKSKIIGKSVEERKRQK